MAARTGVQSSSRMGQTDYFFHIDFGNAFTKLAETTQSESNRRSVIAQPKQREGQI